MGEIKLAQRLAKTAKEVQEDATGLHDMVKLMYEHIIEVAEASAACGRMKVKVTLIYPEILKTKKAISGANKKLCSMLDADGFTSVYLHSNKEGVYELEFRFE